MFFNWATISALIGLSGWIIAVLMLFIVPVNRKPSSATAWLLLIFQLPYFGLILFLLLGSPKLTCGRSKPGTWASAMRSPCKSGKLAQPGRCSTRTSPV